MNEKSYDHFIDFYYSQFYRNAESLDQKGFQSLWCDFAQNVRIASYTPLDLWGHPLTMRAFVHKSFSHEERNLAPKHYERLEFLGDAVLDVFVSQKLFRDYGELAEGKLSKLRGAIVNGESLYALGSWLELPRLLMVGHGEYKKGGDQHRSLVADIFEALLGASSEVLGLVKTMSIFEKLTEDFKLQTGTDLFALSNLDDFDPVTTFQEKVHQTYKIFPTYKQESFEQGVFTLSLKIGEHKFHTLKGESKKKITKRLAKWGLEHFSEIEMAKS